MPKPITAHGFRGMNNLPGMPAKFLDDERRITPSFVLNANVLDEGVILPRGGFQKLLSLSGAHSLADGCSIVLCVATGAAGGPALFRIEAERATEIVPVSGPSRCPMEYVEVGSRIFMSNGYWQGIYNLPDARIMEWGLPLPPAPAITQAEGDLPPGTYKVCYTRFEAPDRLSGNGPVTEISWEGGAAGIRLLDMPSDVLAWITQPNGSEFFLAPVEAGGYITSPYYTQPLPTFEVAPPPPLTCLTLAFGRLWGACGKKVYYSNEFQFEHFRSGSYLPVPEDVVLIAPVNSGLFVNSRTSTWLFKGTTPEKMAMEHLGEGAIPGTLAWAMVEGGAYEPKRARSLCPMWVSPKGAVLGKDSGHLVHLNQERLRINVMSRGAGFHRMINGVVPQTVFSLYGSPREDFDEELQTLFARGRIYIPAPGELQTSGGITIGGEGEYS